MLTCCNLAVGFYACILALNGNYAGAMIAILLAAVFDFADGLAARLLKVCSETGKDLDSLADVVSFGMAPGMILFDFIDRMQHEVSWPHPFLGKMCLVGAFAVPVFSALRLAMFNNDTRQGTSFIGLPVPAHAVLWSSLVNAVSPSFAETGFCAGLSLHRFSIWEAGVPLPLVLAVVAISAIGTSLLLVSPIPMFSLKMSSLKYKGNESRYLTICLSVVLVACFGILGLTLTILSYMLLSIFNRQSE
ncbi:MAG: CDP-alcohol phosphatidyltransferase family protein [Tannerella sp.]|jgi:CDP-diacylglycerol--serine O-phosphatidyltransferase|nr:CDP-alcohol phosphatidyltransferase family protein [Tannerella sp.]